MPGTGLVVMVTMTKKMAAKLGQNYSVPGSVLSTL